MAEDKDIKINIKTTADTTGAEEATKAIDEMGDGAVDAAKAVEDVGGENKFPELAADVKKTGENFAGMQREAAKTTANVEKLETAEKAALEPLDEMVQRMKDLQAEAAEATSEVDKLEESAAAAGDAFQGSDPQLGRLINIERARVAAQLAAGIGQMAGKARQLSRDLAQADEGLSETFGQAATGLESLSSGLGLAAQGFAVGGPFGAAVGGTIGLLTGPLKSAFNEMIADLVKATNAELEAEASVKKLARARELFAAQIRNEKNAAFFDAETAALLRSVRALESRSRIAAAQRAADNQTNDVFNGPATGVQGVNTEITRKIAEIEAGVSEAKQKAELLGQQANLNKAELSLAITRQGEDSQAAKQAAAAAKSSEQSAEQAQERVEEISKLADIEKQKVFTEAAKSFQGLSADVGLSITESASAVKLEIEALAERQGGKLSADIGGALESLTKLLGDSIPDSQQTALLAQAMSIAAGSRDALNGGLSDFFRESANAQNETLRVMRSYASEVKRFREQITRLGGG